MSFEKKGGEKTGMEVKNKKGESGEKNIGTSLLSVTDLLSTCQKIQKG